MPSQLVRRKNTIRDRANHYSASAHLIARFGNVAPAALSCPPLYITYFQLILGLKQERAIGFLFDVHHERISIAVCSTGQGYREAEYTGDISKLKVHIKENPLLPLLTYILSCLILQDNTILVRTDSLRTGVSDPSVHVYRSKDVCAKETVYTG